jgi:hypothetical protein
VPEALLGLWRELHPAAPLQLQLPFAVTTRATGETIEPVRDSEAAEPVRLPQLGPYRAQLRYRASQFNWRFKSAPFQSRVRMADAKPHRWQFAARFRRNAFGWRSQPAIERVREAVLEIKKTARRDPILAAGGAVLFIEKVSPALEHVDSSSGAIGTAVNHAIVELVWIIAKAPADLAKRASWLERLWEALMLDAIP